MTRSFSAAAAAVVAASAASAIISAGPGPAGPGPGGPYSAPSGGGAGGWRGGGGGGGDGAPRKLLPLPRGEGAGRRPPGPVSTWSQENSMLVMIVMGVSGLGKVHACFEYILSRYTPPPTHPPTHFFCFNDSCFKKYPADHMHNTVAHYI